MSHSFRLKPIFVSGVIFLTIAATVAPLVAFAQKYVPPRRGKPERREGAGTRGPNDRCIKGGKPLLALAPADNFSLTTSKTPTLFWYIPTTIAKTGEFRLLRDSDDEEVYTTTTNLDKSPGIFRIQIPTLATSKMKAGEVYRWQFSLICAPKDPSRNPFIEGLIERVEPSTTLVKALGRAKTPQEKASAYASAGIWQEAISTLVERRCAKPNDTALQTSWKNLLTSVELHKVVQEPLTQACHTIK